MLDLEWSPCESGLWNFVSMKCIMVEGRGVCFWGHPAQGEMRQGSWGPRGKMTCACTRMKRWLGLGVDITVSRRVLSRAAGHGLGAVAPESVAIRAWMSRCSSPRLLTCSSTSMLVDGSSRVRSLASRAGERSGSIRRRGKPRGGHARGDYTSWF